MDEFTLRVSAFIADARTKAADGLTLQEAGQLFYAFILLAVDAANTLANSGPERKALVMRWAGELYDVVIKAVPLPWWLSLALTFGGGALRSMVLELVSGFVEAAYLWIKGGA